MKSLLGLAAAVALSGCALKGDVRRVEQQLLELRAETARADTARAVQLDSALASVAALLQTIQDTLSEQQDRALRMHAQTRSDITDVQRQLVQIQELTGQSQQRLTELRRQLGDRATAPTVTAPAGSDSAAGAAPGLPPPDELFALALSQLRRGSPQAARAGFSQFISAYPTHERAPDALFFIGESWASSSPDSASAAYEAVARAHPNSPRAPSALYKLGLLAEQRGDAAAGRMYFERVLAGYPRSEEAALARERLNR